MDLFLGKRRIIKQIKIADNFLIRLIGLLKNKNSKNSNLYIPSCNSIHTFFMKFSIDVIMTDSKGKIVFLKENVKPFQIISCPKAKDTIELEIGSIKKFKIKKGDMIKLKEVINAKR